MSRVSISVDGDDFEIIEGAGVLYLSPNKRIDSFHEWEDVDTETEKQLEQLTATMRDTMQKAADIIKQIETRN